MELPSHYFPVHVCPHIGEAKNRRFMFADHGSHQNVNISVDDENGIIQFWPQIEQGCMKNISMILPSLPLFDQPLNDWMDFDHILGMKNFNDILNDLKYLAKYVPQSRQYFKNNPKGVAAKKFKTWKQILSLCYPDKTEDDQHQPSSSGIHDQKIPTSLDVQNHYNQLKKVLEGVVEKIWKKYKEISEIFNNSCMKGFNRDFYGGLMTVMESYDNSLERLIHCGGPNFKDIYITNVSEDSDCQLKQGKVLHKLSADNPVFQVTTSSAQGNTAFVCVREKHRCLLLGSDESRSRLDLKINLEIGDEILSFISCSPYIRNEVLCSTSKGNVYLWDINTGFSDHLLEKSARFECQDKWSCSYFGGHPRHIVVADNTSVELFDHRTHFSYGMELFALSYQLIKPDERVMTAASLGFPYHCIATDYSVFVVDQRFASVPVLRWSPEFISAPQYVQVLHQQNIKAGEDKLLFMASQQPAEVMCFSVNILSGRAPTSPVIPWRLLPLTEFFEIAESPYKFDLGKMKRRFETSLGGLAVCPQSAKDGFTVYQMDSFGDIYFQTLTHDKYQLKGNSAMQKQKARERCNNWLIACDSQATNCRQNLLDSAAQESMVPLGSITDLYEDFSEHSSMAFQNKNPQAKPVRLNRYKPHRKLTSFKRLPISGTNTQLLLALRDKRDIKEILLKREADHLKKRKKLRQQNLDKVDKKKRRKSLSRRLIASYSNGNSDEDMDTSQNNLTDQLSEMPSEEEVNISFEEIAKQSAEFSSADKLDKTRSVSSSSSREQIDFVRVTRQSTRAAHAAQKPQNDPPVQAFISNDHASGQSDLDYFSSSSEWQPEDSAGSSSSDSQTVPVTRKKKSKRENLELCIKLSIKRSNRKNLELYIKPQKEQALKAKSSHSEQCETHSHKNVLSSLHSLPSPTLGTPTSATFKPHVQETGTGEITSTPGKQTPTFAISNSPIMETVIQTPGKQTPISGTSNSPVMETVLETPGKQTSTFATSNSSIMETMTQTPDHQTSTFTTSNSPIMETVIQTPDHQTSTSTTSNSPVMETVIQRVDTEELLPREQLKSKNAPKGVSGNKTLDAEVLSLGQELGRLAPYSYKQNRKIAKRVNRFSQEHNNSTTESSQVTTEKARKKTKRKVKAVNTRPQHQTLGKQIPIAARSNSPVVETMIETPGKQTPTTATSNSTVVEMMIETPDKQTPTTATSNSLVMETITPSGNQTRTSAAFKFPSLERVTKSCISTLDNQMPTSATFKSPSVERVTQSHISTPDNQTPTSATFKSPSVERVAQSCIPTPANQSPSITNEAILPDLEKLTLSPSLPNQEFSPFKDSTSASKYQQSELSCVAETVDINTSVHKMTNTDHKSHVIQSPSLCSSSNEDEGQSKCTMQTDALSTAASLVSPQQNILTWLAHSHGSQDEQSPHQSDSSIIVPSQNEMVPGSTVRRRLTFQNSNTEINPGTKSTLHGSNVYIESYSSESDEDDAWKNECSPLHPRYKHTTLTPSKMRRLVDPSLSGFLCSPLTQKLGQKIQNSKSQKMTKKKIVY